MDPLPRSRTLPMLRTPAPFRLLAAALGWVCLCAVGLHFVPDLAERARFAALLTDASATRLDPMVEHAQRGRWPASRPIASPHRGSDTVDTLMRRIIEDGIAITQTRMNDRVDVAFDYALSRGDTMSWRCRASVAGGRVAPVSLPAICRE